MSKIKVKRPVTIKTIVTSDFKKQAAEELSKEIQLLESQIIQLELQHKQVIDQVNSFNTQYEESSSQQVQDALEDIATRLQQMSGIKQELMSQRDTINHIALENVIVTGSLENYVELEIGENIYDKFKQAEILVKDGIIQEIKQ